MRELLNTQPRILKSKKCGCISSYRSLGAEAADPSLNIMNLLSPEMAQIVNYARNHGLSELQADVKEAPQTVFKPDADLNPLIEY